MEITRSMKLMTLQETANYLDCSKNSVRKYIDEHRLPVRMVGGSPRVHIDDLTEWLESRKVVKG